LAFVDSSTQEGTRQEQKKFVEECYALALRSAADYAVDFELAATQEFQRRLRALEERVPDSTTETLSSVQASFRGELRDYRDRARAFLQRMRDDLAGAEEAMHTFAGSFVANGHEAESRVRREIKIIEEVVHSDDLGKIRQTILAATGDIARSYDELNRANNLVIAQLQHEIRLLHREMEAERRMAWTDGESGAWVKRKFDDRLGELLKTGDSFCVIVILITNLKRLESQCSKTVVSGSLNALVKRFYGTLGEHSLVARIGEGQFSAIVEVDSATAHIMAREVAERLSARYSVQENGIAQTVSLRVSAGIVEHARGGDSDEFYRKFQRMTGISHSGELSR
jgi:GGDEF domain-containing protein